MVCPEVLQGLDSDEEGRRAGGGDALVGIVTGLEHQSVGTVLKQKCTPSLKSGHIAHFEIYSCTLVQECKILLYGNLHIGRVFF